MHSLVCLVRFLLAFVATTASAGEITTFGWSPGTGWPAGTTVTLCANGICAAGLTGTQHTLDVPVQPGEAISATAQAFAPVNWDCTPAPECRTSATTVFAQTVPPMPTGFSATKEQITQMAITPITGNVAFTSTAGTRASGNVSITLTIPTGARFALISFAGYSSAGAITYSSVTLNSNSATVEANSGTVGNDAYDTALAWVNLSASDEGASRTLAWNQNRALDEGGNVLVRFYSGVESVSPIRQSGVDADESSGTSSVSSSVSLSPQSGDYVVAAAASYSANANVSWSGTGVAEVFEATGGSVNHSWAESTTAGTYNVTATGNFPGLVALVLKPAGVSASLPPHTPSYAHLIVR